MVGAVAASPAKQVLLVVVLGVEERPGFVGRSPVGGDVPETVVVQGLLVCDPGSREGGPLLGRRPVDRRPVLRAAVVALAEPLRRVMVFPEHLQHLQHLLDRDPGRVVGDQDCFGVPGGARAGFLVGRVRGEPALVPDCGGDHAG
jgi:hypothetical protein